MDFLVSEFYNLQRRSTINKRDKGIAIDFDVLLKPVMMTAQWIASQLQIAIRSK